MLDHLTEYKNFAKLLENVSGARTRFAPSSTGACHVGSARTALYNYLLSKNGGSFLLRIEDTDPDRYVEGSEKHIIDSLEWLGITFDEGVHMGGPHAPYKQSERAKTGLYKKYADELVGMGLAYYAFDTEDDVNAMRDRIKTKEDPRPQYGYKTRDLMRNSLTMDKSEVRDLIESNTPHIVRLLVQPGKTVELTDLVRGVVRVRTSELGDVVLHKSDGLPTYHLASIVDDHLMKISHVIRGEEWLPSAPLHAMLYDAFGWNRPEFAHLSVILKPDGRGKLNKRDADALGIPIYPVAWGGSANTDPGKGYREEGFLPMSVVNYIALLGWNPGTEKEIYLTMDDLANDFDIRKVNKAGARFNVDKLKWVNGQHLKAQPIDKVAEILSKELNIDNGDNVEKVAKMLLNRSKSLQDLANQAKPILVDSEPDPKLAGTLSEIEVIKTFCNSLEDVYTKDDSIKVLNDVITKSGLKWNEVTAAMRYLLIGVKKGPDIISLIDVIGLNEALRRLNVY